MQIIYKIVMADIDGGQGRHTEGNQENLKNKRGRPATDNIATV